MSTATPAQDRIAALQAEIEKLQHNAAAELIEKKNALLQQIAALDAQIAELTGKSPEKKTRRGRAAIVGRMPSFGELKDLLSAVPGKTLNLRKEGFDVKNIKQLVAGNPGLFRMGGKGAWPEITLLK